MRRCPNRRWRSDPPTHEHIKLPDELLSPRQKLVLTMLYERDMDVTEVAKSLGVDPQTVRSTHHKAMLKLRSHFAIDDTGKAVGDKTG